MPTDPASDHAQARLGRQYLTLLFSDLSHSTELSELMETEHYADMLRALRVVYQDAVKHHGGTVVRLQGDGLLAMFGYPQTGEDDGAAAVAAAFELHRRVRALKVKLPAGRAPSLHTGIHAGLVLLESGDVELGRFELLGSTPNIAARLSEAAQPHEVVVSVETLGPASRVSHEGSHRMTVRGRASPLDVLRIDARSSGPPTVSTVPGRWTTAFVGREPELMSLREQLDVVMAGKLRSVAVSGSPGLGKTRLVEQFISELGASACLVLRGHCDKSMDSAVRQPFMQMLQSLSLPSLPSLPDSPEAFAQIFCQYAHEQCLLLFVDDWQWADDASRQVLTAIRRMADGKIMIVLSTREKQLVRELGDADQTIELLPAGRGDAVRAITANVPAIDPFMADHICRHADGNFLVLEELCHLASRGDLDNRIDSNQLGTGWLSQLVQSRVQQMSAGQIEVIRCAAIIGNVVPAWLLVELTPRAQNQSVMDALASLDFLYPAEQAGMLRFKHGLTRDIIYDSVGLNERESLHGQIARALERNSKHPDYRDVVDALAFHYGKAGERTLEATYAEAAADRALAVSALDRARFLYRQALLALDDMTRSSQVALRWISIANRLGRVSVFDPVRKELPLHERAVSLAECFGDDLTIARCQHWLGYLLFGLGEPARAITHCNKAIALADEAGDDKLKMQAMAALGEAQCAVGNYQAARPVLDQVIGVKRQFRSTRHNNVGLVFSLVCRAYLLGDQGFFRQSNECFAEARDCIVDSAHEIAATVHGWHGAVLLWQGHWQEAIEAANESSRIAEATRSLSQLSIARAISAFAAWMHHRQPESVQSLREVTSWLEPSDCVLYRSLNHGWLAASLFHLHRRKQARRHAAQALVRARHQDLLGAAMTYRALARDAALFRPEASSHYIHQASIVASARQSRHELAATHLAAAEIAAQHERWQDAEPLLQYCMREFEDMDMSWHLSRAGLVLRRVNSGPADTAPLPSRRQTR
jgi:class 3 adenylate cyclase/tetratricopeptide (TPR) repeat protein